MNSMISQYELRRSQVHTDLLELGLNDVMVKAHIDSFIAGRFYNVEEMLVSLALKLAKDRKHYFDHSLKLLAMQPPLGIIATASESAKPLGNISG